MLQHKKWEIRKKEEDEEEEEEMMISWLQWNRNDVNSSTLMRLMAEKWLRNDEGYFPADVSISLGDATKKMKRKRHRERIE